MKTYTDRTLSGPMPSVAIVGRPNVGKSALFNALLNARISIVHEAAGVTRDRVVAPVVTEGKCFQLVDTGGLGMLKGESQGVSFWDKGIRAQVETAIEDADLIVMVVDTQKGIEPLDREVAQRLHESGKNIILVATKADNSTFTDKSTSKEFLSLGFGEPIAVSSLHRIGINFLMQNIIDELGMHAMAHIPETTAFRIAIVGRPNVGKSSIVNRLLGQERVMVSPVAGTTRDAIDTDFTLNFRGEPRPAVLIDTAGLRKKAKVDEIIEYFSNMRVEDAIKSADMVLFVTEADEFGATAQDKKIARMIVDAKKACVVAINKWDTLKGKKMIEIEKEFRGSLPHMAYAPMTFCCALSGYHFNELLDQIAIVMETLETKITTGILNRTLEDIIARTAPPVVNNSPLRIYYATMTRSQPPSFIFFCNRVEACAPNYKTFLERSLRERFGFIGVPLQIELKARPKTIESIRTRTIVKRGPTSAKRGVTPEDDGSKSSRRVTKGKASKQPRTRKSVTARQKTKKK